MILLTQKQLQELIQLQINKQTPHTPNKKAQINPIITLNDNPINSLAVKAEIQEEEPILHYEIQPNPVVQQHLQTTTFQFSEKTKQRVTNEIHDILKLKESEGLGPREVGRLIQDKFGQLKGYEAERIARTECNRASNTYNYTTLRDDKLIDYMMWISKIDNRTRGQKKHDKANHIKMDGEIIKKDGTFSNGLRFPGDPSGPAQEIINCRCTIVPYIIPYDKVAPNKPYFKESDLLPVPEGDEKQLIIESLEEELPLVTPVEGGFEVTPSNLKIAEQIKNTNTNTVEEVVPKLTPEEMKLYNDLYGKMMCTPSHIKFDPKTMIEPVMTDFVPSPQFTQEDMELLKKLQKQIGLSKLSPAELKEYKKTVEALTKPTSELGNLSAKEQKVYNSLYYKLHSHGGYLKYEPELYGDAVFIGGVPVYGSPLAHEEQNALKYLFKKKNNIPLNSDKIPLPKVISPGPPGLTTSEQAEYNKLYNKLLKNGGTIKYKKYHKNPKITGLNEGVLNPQESKKLKELHKKVVQGKTNSVAETVTETSTAEVTAHISGLTPSQQTKYTELMEKLDENGGHIHYHPQLDDTPILQVNNFTDDEINQIKKLYKQHKDYLYNNKEKLLPQFNPHPPLSGEDLIQKRKSLALKLKNKKFKIKEKDLDSFTDEELDILDHAASQDLLIPNDKGILTKKQAREAINQLQDLSSRGYRPGEVQIDLQCEDMVATSYHRQGYDRRCRETGLTFDVRPNYNRMSQEEYRTLSPQQKFTLYYTRGPSALINRVARHPRSQQREIIKECVRRRKQGGYRFYEQFVGKDYRHMTNEEIVDMMDRHITRWHNMEPSMLKLMGENTVRHHGQGSIYESNATILKQIRDGIINLDDLDLDNIPEDDLIGEIPDNISTSFDADASFSGHHFRMYTEEDVPVASFYDTSYYPDEHEDLIGKHTKYKIFKIEGRRDRLEVYMKVYKE